MNEAGPWIALAALVIAAGTLVLAALSLRNRAGSDTMNLTQAENDRLQRKLDNCEIELDRARKQINDLLDERWRWRRPRAGDEK